MVLEWCNWMKLDEERDSHFPGLARECDWASASILAP